MKKIITLVCITLALVLSSCQKQENNKVQSKDSSNENSQPIAPRPEKLSYKEFKVKVPDAAKYRHTLAGNNVAYIMEDHSLPLVNFSISSRAGWYIVDDKDLGVAYVLDSMLREGGTQTLKPSKLNEKLDFLATRIEFNFGTTSASVQVDTLKTNLDESLNLLFDMLVTPGFDASRLAIEKSKALERIKRRNDDTRNIEPRVWDDLMMGRDFFENRMATAAQIKAVTVAQLKKYSTRIFANGHLVVGVSGDIKTDNMVKKLNSLLTRLPQGSQLPEVPSQIKPAVAGLYGVEKADVTQSRVSVGLPAIQKGNPDEMGIQVMNNILGGGGFTSHIVSRVRSDEGLAYSAGSFFRRPPFYQGYFRAFYQSKNKSVAYALKIVLEEINKIRDQKVSDNELHVAKQSVNSALGNIFRNAQSNVSRFVNDDIQHYPKDYWNNYASNVNKVTVDDVQKLARKYLQPNQLRYLVVGKLEAVEKGDGEHGTLSKITGLQLKQLPLRDPLTLKPLPLNKGK